MALLRKILAIALVLLMLPSFCVTASATYDVKEADMQDELQQQNDWNEGIQEPPQMLPQTDPELLKQDQTQAQLDDIKDQLLNKEQQKWQQRQMTYVQQAIPVLKTT